MSVHTAATCLHIEAQSGQLHDRLISVGAGTVARRDRLAVDLLDLTNNLAEPSATATTPRY